MKQFGWDEDSPRYNFGEDIATCPNCGARSTFVESQSTPGLEEHTCMRCGTQFLVDPDDSDMPHHCPTCEGSPDYDGMPHYPGEHKGDHTCPDCKED